MEIHELLFTDFLASTRILLITISSSLAVNEDVRLARLFFLSVVGGLGPLRAALGALVLVGRLGSSS